MAPLQQLNKVNKGCGKEEYHQQNGTDKDNTSVRAKHDGVNRND
jgi:hypothetical protein